MCCLTESELETIFPHCVELENQDDILKWCRDNFGPDAWKGIAYSRAFAGTFDTKLSWTWYNENIFRFKNKNDALLFKLRWQ